MTYIPNKNIIPTDYADRSIIYSDSGQSLVSCQEKNDIDIKVRNGYISTIHDFRNDAIPSGASATALRNTMIFSATSSDFTRLSKGIITIEPSYDSRIEFMMAFNSPPVNNQRTGLSNSISDMYVGYSASAFGVGYTRDSNNGATVFVPTASFNFGGNPLFQSKFTGFVSSNLNLYAIHVNIVGDITWELYVKGFGWIILHSVSITSDNFSPFAISNFRFFIFTPSNVGGCTTRFCYAQSKKFINKDSNRITRRLGYSVDRAINNATNIPVLTISCPTTHNSLDNVGKIVLHSVFASLYSAVQTYDPAIISLAFNTSLTGSNFFNFNTNYPEFFTRLDTSATSAAGPLLVMYEFNALWFQSNKAFNLPQIELNGGDSISFFVKPITGTYRITLSANWVEII